MPAAAQDPHPHHLPHPRVPHPHLAHHDPLLPIDPDSAAPAGHEAAARHAREGVAALAVAAGGALGGLSRLGVGELLPHRAGTFPWATFSVDVVGCLLIGVLMVVLLESAVRPSPYARPLLGVGVLGGFTTFSAYATDTRALLAGGHAGTALTYLAATLVVGLAATWVGLTGTRAALRVPAEEGAA